MRMALGTSYGGAHPDRHGRIDTIDNSFVAEFLVVGSPLVIGHRIAVEGGCNQLVFGRLRQQIASDLLNGKLVKRFILVQRPNYVIPIGPDSAGRIVGVSGGIGVTGQVEPHPGPTFTRSSGSRFQAGTQQFRQSLRPAL